MREGTILFKQNFTVMDETYFVCCNDPPLNSLRSWKTFELQSIAQFEYNVFTVKES